MQGIKKVLFKFPGLLSIAIFIGFAVSIMLLPSFNQKAGNFFFGTMPALYNVTLAQFFFTRSAYPVFGDSVEYAHYQLSRTHFIKGDLVISLDEAYKELELYPDHVRTYYILGLTYGYLNKEEKAIESFGKFIEANPNSWAARNDKAWLHFRIGDLEGGLETIAPAAEMYPNNPWVQNTYGVLSMNAGQLVEAEEALTRAKDAAARMTPKGWGIAYPGNSPSIYDDGLDAMRMSIESNLQRVRELKNSTDDK